MDTGKLGESQRGQITEKGNPSWIKTDYNDVIKKMELL